MPELPEVETTRRGIEPHVVGRRITSPAWCTSAACAGPWISDWCQRSRAARSAAPAGARNTCCSKPTPGTLILHLGMSGSLRVLPASTPRIAHDHVDIELDSGQTLRFNDPRRFGSLLFTADDPAITRC